MGRKKYHAQTHLSHEFELDLAPLLAVMVKLVPVLLVSSAFVQLTMLETELPQAVKEAVAHNEKAPTTVLQLDVASTGMRLLINEPGKAQQVEVIKNKDDGSFNLPALYQLLVQTKTQHPEVFRLELNPAANIAYRDIVKIMDEARKSKDQGTVFPLTAGGAAQLPVDVRNPASTTETGKQTDQQTDTNYMFPDVVFVNMMEG